MIESKIHPTTSNYYTKNAKRCLMEILPMFALARVVGWSAQWLEQTNDGTKIWRPRQIYNGFNKRDFTIDKKQINGHH